MSFGNKGEQIIMTDEELNDFAREIGESHLMIQALAYQEYCPIAYNMCSREAPEEEVAYHLDRMVSFCGTDDMLDLFKMVCRRYWRLYPDLIGHEILLYKEMFESDDENYEPEAPEETSNG